MQIAIIGGKLQGVEAAYLAKEAGYESVLVDLDPLAPASKICDNFICKDALDQDFLTDLFKDIDIILPAIEDDYVLASVAKAAKNTPFIYDKSAYKISSSKLKSDKMFEEIKVPAPLYWPKCSFPIIAKPNSQSGSQGVSAINDQNELEKYLNKDYILQEYLEGDSYSIEVIGNGKKYAVLQATQLFMDDKYDCCGVIAPAPIPPNAEKQFRDIALTIAQKLKIKGIFDVEIILHNNICKVLEIDARLPSQTPTAVYHSTGKNMLEMLCESVLHNKLPLTKIHAQKAVYYGHIYVEGCNVVTTGEHIMGICGPLHIRKDFFGADTAITNYKEGMRNFAATIIYEGYSTDEVLKRKEQSIEYLKSHNF